MIGAPTHPPISIDRIKAVVAADFGLPRRLLADPRRTAETIMPRHVAIYLAHRLTPHSSVVVGRNFGNRDHSTILYAVAKIASARKTDNALDARLDRLERRLCPPMPRPQVQLSMFIGPLFDRPFEPAVSSSGVLSW